MVNSINICGNNITIVNGRLIGGEGVTGNGNIVTTDRPYTAFGSIAVESSVDVIYSQSNQHCIKVTCDSNLIDLIVTTVTNGLLKISVDGSFSTRNRIKVECSSLCIESASIKGSGDILLNDINVPELNLLVSGSGYIEAIGKVGKLKASVSGSGDIDGIDLAANLADLSINGSGDIKALCTESVSAIVNGSGDIRIRGNPDTVSKSCNGSGSIRVK